VVYRVARQKKETSEAVFDPVLCPDPVAFLTQRLGKLASCKIVLPAEQTSPPTLPPLLAQAVSRVGGVLPLVAEWLVATMPDLFTSERSAKRQLAGVFTSPLPSGRRLAVYSRPGRSRPSQALICDDVSDPRATLERLLGTELRTFRPFDAPGPGPEANGHSAAPSGPGPEAPSLDGVVLGMAGRSLNGLFPASEIAAPIMVVWRTPARRGNRDRAHMPFSFSQSPWRPAFLAHDPHPAQPLLTACRTWYDAL
jgi:hypothetical protein